jgi:ABC-type branched-subunit amino acid transport system substrate-binding protein
MKRFTAGWYPTHCCDAVASPLKLRRGSEREVAVVGNVRFLLTAVLAALWLAAQPARAADETPAQDSPAGAIEVAAVVCLSGDEQPFGQPGLEGMQLAIDEANRRGDAPRIKLRICNEESDVKAAQRAAEAIVKSPAVLVLGSVFTFLSLVEGPVFARAGIAALPTATSDLITRNPTTFRVSLKNSEEGTLLATYLSRVLGSRRVDLLSTDDGYGGTLRSGFMAAADRLGLQVTSITFKTLEEAEQAAHTVADDPARPAVALLMLATPAARIIPILRRGGVTGPIVGSIALGDEDFRARLAREPEEQAHPGALVDGLYATAPMILDSANAETLAFAERFRARYGHDPSWVATSAYDSGQAAVAAIRAAAAAGAADPAALRAGVLRALTALDAPAHSVHGLLGPIWFDQDRGRTEAIRVGRFSGGHYISAPVQIVPVPLPSASEMASGAVFELAPGHYGRLQRVVYSGVFLNDISHIDLQRSSFGADFYVWLRYARDAGADSIDPAEISFPNMLSGGFDPARPAEQGEMPDGTVYRLWRVQGEFRNDYDLHAFPFDHQRLELPFYNARGASDRIIYVLDRRASAGGAPADPAAGRTAPIASPDAFAELTQWQALGGTERRENLVTGSALGDPRRIGSQDYRELSGFIATFDVQRRWLSTVAKTLMPLLLMTLIIYATLHFPPVLIKERVTVAVTGALSGAVLLTAINSQLGGVGYTIAIEYAFFMFFGLTTFIIVAALAGHHLRHGKHERWAKVTEQGTRAVFILAILGVAAGAWWVAAGAGTAG